MLFLSAVISFLAPQQDSLSRHPRFEKFQEALRKVGEMNPGGVVVGSWGSDGKFYFRGGGKSFVFDPKVRLLGEGTEPTTASSGQQRRRPGRGRQFDTAFTPDGAKKAFVRDRNVYLSNADGSGMVQVTSDGGEATRIKNGVASWVYGEELDQLEAMWFSPDGKFLAYYRFDETQVKDYYLALDQGEIQSTVDREAYPKAGASNPKVAIVIYELATGKKKIVDAEFGPNGADLSHYLFGVRWSPDGKELLFKRMNRRQNQLEVVASNPVTGVGRTVLEEKSADGWVSDSQTSWYASGGKDVSWLDKEKFFWISDRSGYRNLYLGSIKGGPLKPLTQNKFDIERVVAVDSQLKSVWYMGRDGDNPYLLQLHKVSMDGTNDKRLTSPKWHHQCTVSPETGYFLDVRQNLTSPPQSVVCDPAGSFIAPLATGDAKKLEAAKYGQIERITYTAADGQTVCYGTLLKPSDFDPNKKYPVLVSVYGGPESGSMTENFPGGFGLRMKQALAELGFLVADFDGRGTWGRGRSFTQCVYGKLGQIEIDDQAAGVKALAERPYVDSSRVGIFGTSYGGYASLMALLRYPSVFKAASASSSVTKWENYDTIYTERYMGMPQANPEGYKNASAMTYAANLTGALQIYYGTADNNVHPANTLQLVRVLNGAGRKYELWVGTDMEHTMVNLNTMAEFFVRQLKP